MEIAWVRFRLANQFAACFVLDFLEKTGSRLRKLPRFSVGDNRETHVADCATARVRAAHLG